MTEPIPLSYEDALEHLHGLLGSRVMAATQPADDPLTALAVVGELCFGMEADLADFATDQPQLVDETIFFRVGAPVIGPNGTGGFFTISRSNLLSALLTRSDLGSLKLVVTMHGGLALHVQPASDFGL